MGIHDNNLQDSQASADQTGSLLQAASSLSFFF